jgi:hypothetical protein
MENYFSRLATATGIPAEWAENNRILQPLALVYRNYPDCLFVRFQPDLMLF